MRADRARTGTRHPRRTPPGGRRRSTRGARSPARSASSVSARRCAANHLRDPVRGDDPTGEERPPERAHVRGRGVDPAVAAPPHGEMEDVAPPRAVDLDVTEGGPGGSSSERRNAVSVNPARRHTRCSTSSWKGMPLARSAMSASTT